MQFHKSEITPEWQDLVEEYPEIFLEPSPEVLDWYEKAKDYKYFGFKNKEDLCNLRYGFECNVGWKEIIREFCAKVRELVNEAKENGHEIHHTTFILKEKFGTLCDQGMFYGPDRGLYIERFYDILRELEDKSAHTCELTGKPGKLVSRDGWWKTLCEEESTKLGYGE